MAKIMTLPKIGVNMTEATIGKWLVEVGDVVKMEDPILEAETDKSTQEIYATEEGIVAKLFAGEGDTVQCYENLMALVEEGEEYVEEAEVPKAKEEVPKADAPVTSAETKAVSLPGTTKEGRIRISPLAKKMAKEMGIPLNAITPAIPGGRIVKADVLAYKPAAAIAEPDILEVIPMSTIRKVTAARMSESYFGRPTVPLTASLDGSGLLALRKIYKDKGIKVSVDAIIAKFAAKALSEYRMMNTELQDNNIVVYNKINVGVAVDTEKGLMVPVVKNTDKKSLLEVNEDLAELVGKAKEGKLSGDDMSGSTFTVTNLGMFGIESFAPIINVPNCAILGVGAMTKQFVPDSQGNPVLQNRVNMTLVFDHRIVDGAAAAKFLKQLKEYIECPQLMI